MKSPRFISCIVIDAYRHKVESPIRPRANIKTYCNYCFKFCSRYERPEGGQASGRPPHSRGPAREGAQPERYTVGYGIYGTVRVLWADAVMRVTVVTSEIDN